MANRTPILGQLDRDVACAVALAIVEHPNVIANLDSVTLLDASMRPLGTEPNWLGGDDPLDTLTRDYLRARREASTASVRRPGQTGWAAASAVKTRDEAIRRAQQARERGRALLVERGVIAGARQAGLKVLAAD
jgi:hypothetical protein